MEIRFPCSACGHPLVAEEVDATKTADCPICGVEFTIPSATRVRARPKATESDNQGPPPGGGSIEAADGDSSHALAEPNAEGELTCPVCWLRFDIGDIMHIAVHD